MTLHQSFDYDTFGRMNQVAFSNYVASYTFVANSDLQQNTLFYKPGASLVMTTTRSYEYGFRLKGITNLSAASVNLASHAYLYDSLNRRTQATREDASYWAYGYNDRDEVTTGNQKGVKKVSVPAKKVSVPAIGENAWIARRRLRAVRP